MAFKLYSESALTAELGQRLKQHRLSRNMLQKELAQKHRNSNTHQNATFNRELPMKHT